MNQLRPDPLANDLSRDIAPIARGRTTTDEVVDRLILAIARGRKAPGERITEAEVAAAFHVSRVPAREAMQKLQLRGVLVGGPDQRGLRVVDYGEKRLADLYELRLAMETIFFRHVLASDGDRASLVRDLKATLKAMAALSGSGDPVALASVDLEFHRAVARHSGNDMAVEIWEGLAQHLLIVFCRDWADAADQTGEVRLHARLIDFIEDGDPADIEAVLRNHFSPPFARSRQAGTA